MSKLYFCSGCIKSSDPILDKEPLQPFNNYLLTLTCDKCGGHVHYKYHANGPEDHEKAKEKIYEMWNAGNDPIMNSFF